MQPELSDEEYFDNIRLLTTKPEFKVLCEELQRLRDGYNDLSSSNSLEELWFRKGQIHTIDYILNLEAFVDASNS